MQQIRNVAGDAIAGMTPTVTVPAMLSFQYGGNWVTRPVQLIGVDEKTQAEAGDFAQYLQHPENRKNFNFDLRQDGYDKSGDRTTRRRNADREIAPGRLEASSAGRQTAAGLRNRAAEDQRQESRSGQARKIRSPSQPTAATGRNRNRPSRPAARSIRSTRRRTQAEVFDPLKQQHTGVVLGMALATFRDRQGDERFLVLPGDDMKLTFPTAGTPPRAIDDAFTIVDFYECKMSEYDCQLCVRSARSAAGTAGHGRTETGHALRHEHSDSSQARRRCPGRSRQAARRLSARVVRRVHLARQARSPAGRRADGNRHPERAVVS